MADDEKLRIAIDALLSIYKLDGDSADFEDRVSDLARGALRDIKRDHYLFTLSPVVAEGLTGVRQLVLFAEYD